MALEQEKNIPLYSLLLQTYAQPQHFFFFFFTALAFPGLPSLSINKNSRVQRGE